MSLPHNMAANDRVEFIDVTVPRCVMLEACILMMCIKAYLFVIVKVLENCQYNP